MDRRERERFTGLLDLIDGGGAGRSGNQFEGGLLSDILNALGVRPLGFRERQEEMGQTRPMMRPAMTAPTYQPAPAGVPLSAQPGYLSPTGPQALPENEPINRRFGIVPIPSASERYMTRYGLTPEQMLLSMPPGGMTAPAMDAGVSLPQPDARRVPLVGYLPQAAMPNDPRITLEMLQSLPIDPITGLPMAMMPPRLPY
jgi:hypothetical protein